MMKKNQGCMQRVVVLLVLMGVSGPVAAADAEKGRVLHDKACAACHASRFGGDASRIYTRPDHKKKSKQEVAAMVAFCSQNLGTQWFDEEVADVTEYLNKNFYKYP